MNLPTDGHPSISAPGPVPSASEVLEKIRAALTNPALPPMSRTSLTDFAGILKDHPEASVTDPVFMALVDTYAGAKK